MFLLQIWFIGRTLASQAGKAGSIPVICFYIYRKCAKTCRKGSLRIFNLHNSSPQIVSLTEKWQILILKVHFVLYKSAEMRK